MKKLRSKVSLKSFSNSSFDKGAGLSRIIMWRLISLILFESSWFPFMGIKKVLLQLFGADIGNGIVIKPSVTIKFPWKLRIGNNCWIGEKVWIDNLDFVTIGDDVCLSQGAMLLTGNHDFTKSSFDYLNAPIILEDGVWIGAMSVVCPGVTCRSHSVLTVGSVATKTLSSFSIYQGNPGSKIKQRIILE